MALASFALLLQTTWVVNSNGGPGVNFTDIPPAIAAAATGDILLVQTGTYSHFTLTGKGLRILGSGATGPTPVFVMNPGTNGATTTVDSIPGGSIAHLSGMRFLGPLGGPPGGASRLEVLGASTRATLADLLVFAPNSAPPASGGAALLVDAAQVRIVRCEFNGGTGADAAPLGATSGGPGLLVRNAAEVHASSSILAGGTGGGGVCIGGPGGSGGPGARVESGSQVFLGDTLASGAAPGCCFISPGASCGDGGDGISADASFVRVSGDSTSIARGGSLPGGAFCTPIPGSVPGAGIETSGGAIVEVHSTPVTGGCTLPPAACGGNCAPGPATIGSGINLTAPALPVLRLTGSLTSTGSVTISITGGPPNSLFVLALSTVPDLVAIGPPLLGEFLLDPPTWIPFVTGFLTTAGAFSVTFPLTGISPALLNLPFHMQVGALESGGSTWRMSNASVGTIRA
jgi:hypothetical protein